MDFLLQLSPFLLYNKQWVNYFKLANMKNLLKSTDEWLRRRLRMYIWKRVRTRYAMLRMPGLDHNKAFMFACTRKGYWRITNAIFSLLLLPMPAKAGRVYIFSDYYKAVAA